MKRFLKKIVLFLLERLVHWRLKKIKPEIIGITGSVGKTSAKEALFAVLSSKESTYCNRNSLNTEFGAMLTVLEQDSGYSSGKKWLISLCKGAWSTWRLNPKKPPYRTLILEMGADKPGDIAYLLKHLHPTLGILLNVKGVHMAEGQFPTVEAVLEEKAKLIRALPTHGVAILNADDPRVDFLASELRCQVLRYGTTAGVDLRATHLSSDAQGLRFTAHFKDQTVSFHCPHLLGQHHVTVLLPAIAVSLVKGLSLSAIAKVLHPFKLPPGRLNRMEGLNGSILVDSSYNASPEATLAALDVLASMPGRRIAALGSMNELGIHSKAEHLKMGRHVPTVAHLLVTVGKEAHYYAVGAQESGMKPSAIHEFDTSLEAADFLKTIVRKGDVILAKGSQNNVRMEYLVKALMQHPEDAPKQLVRQEPYWQTH